LNDAGQVVGYSSSDPYRVQSVGLWPNSIVIAADSPLPTVAANERGSIAAAPDDNVRFTEDSAQDVGRITPSGQISEFPIP
jgi:hypothetical protein